MASEESSPTTSNSSIDEKKFINMLTRCVFCRTAAVVKVDGLDPFQLLPCCHVICSKCVESWNETESHKLCPKCQVNIERKFQSHRLLGDLTLKFDKTAQTCGIHQGQSLNYWCLGCKQLICDTCIAAHNELKSTRDHVIKDKTHITFHKTPVFCTKHPQEHVSQFCVPCNVLTCRDCQLIDHQGHSYKPASEIAEKSKMDIGEEYLELSTKLHKMNTILKAAKKKKSSVENVGDTRKEELVRIERALVKTVRNTMKKFEGRVDIDRSILNNEFEERIREVEINIAPNHQAISFLWALISKGSHDDILYYSDFIVNRMKNMPGIPEEPEGSPAHRLFQRIDPRAVELELKTDLENTMNEWGKMTDTNNNDKKDDAKKGAEEVKKGAEVAKKKRGEAYKKKSHSHEKNREKDKKPNGDTKKKDKVNNGTHRKCDKESHSDKSSLKSVDLFQPGKDKRISKAEKSQANALDGKNVQHKDKNGKETAPRPEPPKEERKASMKKMLPVASISTVPIPAVTNSIGNKVDDVTPPKRTSLAPQPRVKESVVQRKYLPVTAARPAKCDPVTVAAVQSYHLPGDLLKLDVAVSPISSGHRYRLPCVVAPNLPTLPTSSPPPFLYPPAPPTGGGAPPRNNALVPLKRPLSAAAPSTTPWFILPPKVGRFQNPSVEWHRRQTGN